jgi:hypothetical protein
MLREGLLGAVAGAAGTLAIEVTTYGDMLLRGRSASSVPARVAGVLADDLDLPFLTTDQTGDQADNRRSAAGALLGYGLGVGLGITYGLLRAGLGQPRLPLAGAGLGLAAMTMSDSSYALTGVSDPRTWTAADWLSDLIPHLVYGLVTVATYETIAGRNEQ